MCNAHNSEFENDGDLVLGPATTGLAKVSIKVSRGVATIG
jgi:Rieske Fe-S protein